MRPIEEIKKNHRLMIVREGWDGFMAYLVHPQYKPQTVAIVASWGGGWEHVSVSLPRRCPTWDEMCLIKDIAEAIGKSTGKSVQVRPAKTCKTLSDALREISDALREVFGAK